MLSLPTYPRSNFLVLCDCQNSPSPHAARKSRARVNECRGSAAHFIELNIGCGRVSLVRNTVLRVTGVVLEDQGLYECRILLLDKPSDELRNSTWTLLSVTAPPTFTLTPPAVVEALVGRRLSFTCAANGNPTPTLTWLKDGDVIQGENAQVRNGTITLPAVSMQSGGHYTCHASNTEGNVTHVMKLKIKGPPVIVLPPKSTSLNMSQNALLRCQAVADPPNMTYVWQRRGENVHHIESLKSRVKIMVDGTLLISRLIPDDSGNYTCTPTNGVLTPPTASATLTVMHPAQALQMPKETYLPTGMDGVVNCPAIAQPPLVRVDWTKDGGLLDLALYPGWTLTSVGSLSIATVNDDVAGMYTCTPYNSYGSMGSSGPTRVILQDPPSFNIMPQKQYEQEVGATLLIPCQGNDPDTTVTWTKVGQAPRSAYSVLVNGSLLLQPIIKDHQGEWECSAANRVALVKASTLVLVLGTSPHAATSLSVSPGPRQANISWEAGFDGGSAQTFSVWVKPVSLTDNDAKQGWFSVNVPPSSGTRLQVTGLSPATEYQFSVLSQNKVGTGPFSEIASFQTLDPPPNRSKLKPPLLLSANQGSAGVVLQWSPPAAQNPPITGFVLQSRAEQGEWFNLDEDISANSSEIIVSGLRKDSVYELRLLSRQGELLSEPSPSVNVSTMGMEIYPSTSRVEFVPEPLLAGVMGGIGFMFLALLLLLGSACVISHKREQRRRKRKDELSPAIHKCPSSIRTSGTGSPDSVLKKKLLPPHTLYPTTSSTSSYSQSDRSSLSKASYGECQYQHQQPLSNSHDTFNHDHKRVASFPISKPPLEPIPRSPDGRFVVQPYDQASTLSIDRKRSLRKDHFQSTVIQRSVSLHSERGNRREPPFVLSVDLPPCGPVESSSTHLMQAMAQHLSLHGHCILNKEHEGEGFSDQSSLNSDSSCDPDQDISPSYPILKSIDKPPTTASALVLQMEHERERGNLSRCLKLAQEREELEKELQKYSLERGTMGKMRGDFQGTKLEERNEIREASDNDNVWKHSSSIFQHSHTHGRRRSCGQLKGSSFSACNHWESLHNTHSPTNPVPFRNILNASPPMGSSICGSIASSPVPLFTKQSSVRCEGDRSNFKDRLSHPHLPSKYQRQENAVAEPGGYDDSPQFTDTGMQRNYSCSEAWRVNNFSQRSLSTPPFSHTNRHAETSDLAVTAVLDLSKSDIAVSCPCETRSEDMCIEMSVDEPELGVFIMPPTKPMINNRNAPEEESSAHQKKCGDVNNKSSQSNNQSFSAEDDFERRHHQRCNTSQSSPRPQDPVFCKAMSESSQNWEYYQRNQSLDSERQNQSNFLTPDAWIDSINQEKTSSPFSFRPDTLLWESQSTPTPENPRPRRDSPSSDHSPSPQPVEKSPTASAPPSSMDPPSPRRSPHKLTTDPTMPCHRDPKRQTSMFPDASRWPVTYQEALRSMQHMEAMKENGRGSMPTLTDRSHRNNPKPPEQRGRPTHASLNRGFSWPSPDQAPPLATEGKKTRQVKKEETEVEFEGHVRGSESGGSYSSYASSGRGSLEPANGRLSLCFSPTLTSSPETVEESGENMEDKDLQLMELMERRKASVDENYEWDTADIALQSDDHNGPPSSMNLQKPASSCNLPGMQCSTKALNDWSQLSLLQGHRHSSLYAEPQTDTVLF
ncbi:protein turtle homolog A-like [Lampris incognitus]|uniref:protein turtle homolog A-like n=1 Tax=Lampris incognitus TaxID=2546036 RepID=UPI0024B511ED|nr:protein turtle homolog A-like [Lampris incognitus]